VLPAVSAVVFKTAAVLFREDVAGVAAAVVAAPRGAVVGGSGGMSGSQTRPTTGHLSEGSW